MNVEATNFLLVKSTIRQFPMTVSKKNILDKKMKQKFVFSAIRSQRDNIFIEKKVIEEHFN